MTRYELSNIGTSKKLDWLFRFLEKNGTKILRNRILKYVGLSIAEKWFLRDNSKRKRSRIDVPPGVADDRSSMGIAIFNSVKRALNDYKLSDATLDKTINVLLKDLFLQKELRVQKSIEFRKIHGFNTPSFLVISPSRACNLRCVGCYADSDEKVQTLDWDIVNKIVNDARELWGTQFIVISGGEPMAYKSQGKNILDLVENNPHTFFMMYTNGTLIDDKAVERMAMLGNIIPVMSLEGWREKTDARRGKGVFDQVMAAMDRLFQAGVLYGVSLTATRNNAEEILSDKFIEFLFEEKHAVIGWIFQYMPIGRSFTLDLMPTPDQRLEMWRQSWKLVREKKVFLADFWNHGTLVDGCLSAGGHDNGGYFYIEWNGNVTPCVFVPYSPVNVNDIYSNYGNINDIYNNPFFADIRNWQKNGTDGNLLMPCLIRDHNKDLRQFIRKYEANPIDKNAEAAIMDGNYAKGMDQYAKNYHALSDEVWKKQYLEKK
ncbi:MAG: radical SAM protein [Anaerolineaceae bacterium]|nr:radical SAM protein [Anaerolineaceae bacterium]